MAKSTETQRSFILGVLRSGFLEGDDLELRKTSLRGGKNMRVEATRTLRDRPGTFFVREKSDAYDMIEIRPSTDLVFGLLVGDTTLSVIDSTGNTVWTQDPAPWTDGADVWVEPFRETTVIGGSWGLKELTYASGTWTLTDYAFGEAAGGESAQPYWSFRGDVSIQPSATTGSITVTASQAIFTTDYVGLRLRYGRREIEVTGYTSPTVVSGTVITRLPPSYRVGVNSTTGFRIGDAVIGADTDYQGLITAVGATTIDVATLEFFGGPDVGERIVAPSGSSNVVSTTEIAPVNSPIWDEPLISPVRGYPRSGASAAGRLAFVDFPLVPDVICLSSTRSVNDFGVGASDDDAIVRQVGDNAPRFLHVVNAGDLLFFSDRGLYYVGIRDTSLLTPSTFNAVLFDKRASSPVRPVVVDDGVVFVEADGQSIAACLLDGNIYLKWSVRTISTYHNEIISAPVKLCGPSLYSTTPEKYLFVVNADGTLAAMSWFEDFSIETIGFIPWETDGAFKSVSPLFGTYWAIVEREIGGSDTILIERFSDESVVDCACAIGVPDTLEVNGADLDVNGDTLTVEAYGAEILAGLEVALVGDGWFAGTRSVGVDGMVPETEGLPSDAYVGLDFDVYMQVWPVERIDTPRSGMLKARVIRGSFSVKDTLTAYVRANRTRKEFGGYSFGDDLSEPAPLRTKVYKYSVVGNRDHPDIEIGRAVPGPIKILASTQEVSY